MLLNPVPQEQIDLFMEIGNALAEDNQELINLIFNDTGVYGIYKDFNTGDLKDVVLATTTPIN